MLAAAIASTVLLAVGIVGNLIVGSTDWVLLRSAILFALLGCTYVLRSHYELTIGQLRWFELAIFGAIFVQLILMMLTRMSGFAAAGNVAAAASVQYIYLNAWSVLVLTYGIFMPNRGRRGAMIMIPMACIPYLVLWIYRWMSPSVNETLASVGFSSPVPMPMVAAIVGIYGTHVINAVRSRGFQGQAVGAVPVGRTTRNGRAWASSTRRNMSC